MNFERLFQKSFRKGIYISYSERRKYNLIVCALLSAIVFSLRVLLNLRILRISLIIYILVLLNTSVYSQSNLYNYGRYVLVEDQVFNNPAPLSYNGYDSVVYRRCTFQNRSTTSDGSVISLVNIGLVKFESCSFINLRRTTRGDYHGINAKKSIDKFIVRNCRFENISADGIQIGQSVYDDTTNADINYALIEYSTFINPDNTSTENGIDWKGGCSISGIIQNCTFRGYNFCNTEDGCTGANGEAIVVHYRLSRNLTIRNNIITSSNVGIVITAGSAGGNELLEAGPKNVTVSGNKVSCNYAGIQGYEAENLNIYNNFVSDAKYGIWLSMLKDIKVNHNTVVNCGQNSFVEFVSSTGTSQYMNNLAVGTGGVSMDITGSNNKYTSDLASLHFVNAQQNDFHLTGESVFALNQGINNGVNNDIDGDVRNSGSVDIGADEYASSIPENQPPTANAGPDQNLTDSDLNGSEPVTLDGTGSTDPDGNIVSYIWRENSQQIATGAKPAVTFSTGTHLIQLTVTDDDGATGVDNMNLTIQAGEPSNQPPTANAGPDQNLTDSDLNGSEPVTLDGTGSTDPDGNIVSYIWRENSQQIATGAKPAVTFSTGTHLIQLTVTDDDGATDYDEIVLEISKGTEINNPPVILDQVFNVYENDLQEVIDTIFAADPDNDDLIFSIISGNESNNFKVGATTGILSFNILPVDFFDANSFKLEIGVTDNEYDAIAWISVNLVPKGSVFYIDPEKADTSAQDGSIDRPFTSWNMIHWIEGAAYLQKRNTVSYENTIQIGADSVFMGAYGSGENPMIISLAQTSAIYSSGSNFSVQNLNIETVEASSCIFIEGGDTNHISIKGCLLQNAYFGIQITNGGYIEIFGNDIRNTYDAISIQTRFADINYNNFIDNVRAINYNNSMTDSRINNNVFYKNEVGIIANEAQTVIYNNIFYMTSNTAVAINHLKENCLEDYNIFYPDHPGFITLDNVAYEDFNSFHEETGLSQNSFSQDPLFRNADGYNFETHDNSPAIDAGIFIGLLEDMYGSTVPLGKAPDIGSYEKSSLTGINPKSMTPEINDIKVFPNPSYGLVTIEALNGQTFCSAEVLDQTGRIVYINSSSFSDSLLKSTLDLQLLKKGTYLMKLYTRDEKVSVKMLILR